jgi:iron complex outermembrane receptor protein
MSKWVVLAATTGVSLIAMTAPSVLVSAALAQDAPQAAGSETDSNDIVVTAQRRDERLQNVPIAVTAISAEQVQSAGLAVTTDLGKVTPGLTTIQGSGFYTPYIRGVGARSITPGNESTVATYVDGVYQTDKAGLLLSGFSDVASLQVLRGPQGTLFGRNATAGAVLVTTKGPSDVFEGNIEGTLGSDEQNAKLFLAAPIAPTLSASIAAFYRHTDDYIKNLNPANGAGDEVGSSKSYGVRGKIRWEPTPEFSAVIAADYVKSTDEAPWAPQAIKGTGLTLGEAVAAANGVAIPDIRNRRPVWAGEARPLVVAEGMGQSLTLNWDAGAVSLKSITAHRSDKSSGTLDLDGTPLPLFYFKTDLKSNVWQQETTISSNGDGPFNWMTGVYYMNMRDGYRDLDQNVGIPFEYTPEKLAALAPGASHTNQYSYVRIKSLGLFGEASYKFSDADKLTLGLRYTIEKHALDPDSKSITVVPDGEGGLTTLPANTFTALCAATPSCDGLSTKFKRLTWRAVYSHQFDTDVMGYVSYNRGFKSGVYNISTITAANLEATDPETVDAFEVGLKTQFLNRRVTLNISGYYNSYKDMQVPVTIPTNNTQISINAAKAKIAGIEVEAVIRATDNLTFQLGASQFLKREYASFEDCSVYVSTGFGNAIATPAPDCSGKRLPSTPNTYNARAEYRMPLDAGSSITFNGLFSYSSAFDHAPFASAATRAPMQKPIYTVNLSATYRSPDEKFYATIWGRDLADQKDVFIGLFTTAFGYQTTYTRGATWGGTIGYNF